MIPKRLVRTVPQETTEECEQWWDQARYLHPGWEHVTLRDPINPDYLPLTSRYWSACESGAQLADLVRAEELYHRGGVYVDSDYEVLHPFDPLLRLNAFAGWEDEKVICNAVMGFEPRHEALREVIDLAIARQDQGTWASGVGTVTEVFQNHPDILLLPPQALYPVHYKHKGLIDLWEPENNPWTFGIHHWAHSWA